MKKSLVVVALAGTLAVLWVSALFADWEPDVRLTYNDSVSQTAWYDPQSVAAGPGGDVHVVWYDHRDGNDEIYYKRSLNRGTSWDPDFRFTQDSSVSKDPSVALSGSYVHVVWADSRNVTPEIYYRGSANGGTSWGSPTRLSRFDSISSGLLSVASSGVFVHVVWTDGQDGNDEIYYKRSGDNGGNWTPDQRLTFDSNISGYSSVAASGPYVYVVWEDRRGDRFNIYYKRSTNYGVSWTGDTLLSDNGQSTVEVSFPSVVTSGPNVHVVWQSDKDLNPEIYYRRSTNYGANWDPITRLTVNNGFSYYPSVGVSGDSVHVVWVDDRDGSLHPGIYYKRSTNSGASWGLDTHLNYDPYTWAIYPSVAASGTNVHVVWRDLRDGNAEIYYKRDLTGQGFRGFLTDSSNARHLIRDPSRGHLHLVMKSEVDNKIYYSRSMNDGTTWSLPESIGSGLIGVPLCPTIGLAQLPWAVWPPYYAVCVAYQKLNSNQLVYLWNDGFSNPGTGLWHSNTITTDVYPGSPSLTTSGQRVYLAYQAGEFKKLYCDNFMFGYTDFVRETIDNGASGVPSQPSLAVDGNGEIYGAWKKADTIYYAPRGGFLLPSWDRSTWLRVDFTTDPSQQPFVECYGDSVFVAWSDGQPAPSDVWRASKELTYLNGWRQRFNVSFSSNLASESPTQAWREFTTWSDSTSGAQSDVWYYSPYWGRGDVQANTPTWSYWPHSQMSYTMAGGAYLWSAWTESPVRNQPPYTVLTNMRYFAPPPPPGGGDSFSGYYPVQAGQDTPSVYCRQRDGVIRFADKAVDYARDSLVYELPYLDPVYDYYLRVSSYREAGSNWAQVLSVGDSLIRSVQFRSNRVDTAWMKIPPQAYQKDRKVKFSLKNVKGDYVTSLGLMLYQRDPRRGKGGPQIGEAVVLPVREVFAVSPNPMNNQALIEYSLTSPGKVDLSVYDVAGRLVRRVVDAAQPAGAHKVTWDGCDQAGRRVSSGIYFVRLTSPAKVKTARLVVVR